MNVSTVTEFHNSPAICLPGHTPGCQILIGSGAVNALPNALHNLQSKKVFMLSDQSTYQAAGERVCSILQAAGILFVSFSFPMTHPEPDEASVGLAAMHLDPACDTIIGVGSGVINDIGKILANITGKPYIIVGTAPSMDGYASATSSMSCSGLKISLPSKCPDVIIGDTQILRDAPIRLLVSGLGDMLAKYVSICEWRIAHIITGESYSEEIAAMVRNALKKCTDNAQGLMQREENAVQAVFEGLVVCGVAMKYAGLSRPASGMEHYISHVLDMRGAALGTPTETHGIQCALGTLLTVRLYEKLRSLKPNREQALAHATTFDFNVHCTKLRSLLGSAAETMIAQESKDGKYDKTKHPARLEKILKNWEKILDILDQELPSSAAMVQMLELLQIPMTLGEIGTKDALLPQILEATRDIRDKYVLSRLLWDLGITPEMLL